MKYIILGATYPIRYYLQLAGCIYTGSGFEKNWYYAHEDLLDKLKKYGLSAQSIRRITIKKVLKKDIDKPEAKL